ncbi:MAG TPA: NUDIX domain-containing protein [Patescibacteria group bacterium]|nr:NUDIX domain-containing protein [Patescibacteria group bacterium]
MSEKLFNIGIKAIIKRGNKVLILKTTKGSYWEVPGGRMDADETVVETLRRELNEELPNIKTIEIGEIVCATRIHKDIKENVSLVLIFYHVDASFEGEVIQISAEHDAYKWATKDQALKIVYDKNKEAIEAAFK